jgi:hypothetical protein
MHIHLGKFTLQTNRRHDDKEEMQATWHNSFSIPQPAIMKESIRKRSLVTIGNLENWKNEFIFPNLN